MKLLSLNVNQFCGIKNWNEVKQEKRTCYMNQIIGFIKGYLMYNNDGVIILQEVPGKTLYKQYDLFVSAFQNKHYQVICPQNENTNQLTIAITNDVSYWEEKTDFYGNVKEIFDKIESKKEKTV